MNEYGYDDETLDAEQQQVREIDLPAVVRNWEKTAISYSRHNNIPSIIGFYSILGDLVKRFIEIPYGQTTTDTRIHYVWIQTARSGKTTLVMYVLTPVAKKIFEELENDPYVESAVLNLADYTTASLVGDHIFNENFKEDAGDILEKELRAIEGDPMNGIAPTRNFNNDDERIQAVNEAYETYEMSKERWIIDYGPLHGEGIWFADEFEGSGVFKDKAHKENMNILFQTLMNNFHSGANQYPKALKGKPTIHLDSKHTMIALTFPPEHLLKTVADKGILQRFLPFIWDVPDDILTAMRKEVIGGFGTRVERRGPPLHLAKGLLEIYKATKAQFEANGKDPFNTITYHPSAKDALDMAHDSILKYINDVHPKIRNVVRLFEMNLLEYIGKLAVLNTLAMAKNITDVNKRFVVYPQNVRQGAYIVRKCYVTLVEWLENAIKADRRTIITKSNWKEFQHAYQVATDRAKPQEVLEGGFVWKKLVLNEAAKIIGQSPKTINDKFNKLSEMFEEKKVGVKPYIRPKKQQEE
ncbi:MAG: hypothetical protein GOVbin1782_117 [Prokaryotic dsDNA virus sp.]|nr:MAG: hypothetical protein GOVbin1782_117 [Prokaryotic dsDNA virus sp.]|tara:strand:- start:18868 stop:20445 length:1578 start_codon:yes stop_codon:yes gene_type:complete